jgi:hypothetical protein
MSLILAFLPVCPGVTCEVVYQRTPISPLRVQRFRLPQAGNRDYLELNSYIFYGYVACFPHGEDLYIG